MATELQLAFMHYEDMVSRRACGDRSDAAVQKARERIESLFAINQGAAEPVSAKERDPSAWAVIEELREAAYQALQSDPAAGIFPDHDYAQILEEWADRLEICATAFYEDVYTQCCDAIKPLVDAGKLPGSVVESVQAMVKCESSAPPAVMPAAPSDADNRFLKSADDRWEENGRLLGHAISVFGDVLGDISDWEDKALAEAVEEARNGLLRVAMTDKPSNICADATLSQTMQPQAEPESKGEGK